MSEVTFGSQILKRDKHETAWTESGQDDSCHILVPLFLALIFFFSVITLRMTAKVFLRLCLFGAYCRRQERKDSSTRERDDK